MKEGGGLPPPSFSLEVVMYDQVWPHLWGVLSQCMPYCLGLLAICLGLGWGIDTIKAYASRNR